jgi:tetratricopeptide (TPR) repeat protein
MTSLALALLLAPPARASDFLDALRRAESRGAKDPERIEFAARAIRAWRPSDGEQLLADAYFRRGEGEFEAWDDAAAEADFGKAYGLDARNDLALLRRGRARLRAGRATDAERDFSNYAEGRPDDGEGWLALAEARVARGLPHADRPALEAIKKAESLLDDGDPRPWIAEGRAHLAAGRPKEALDALDAAVSDGKDALPDALAWRARAKDGLRDLRGARTDGGRASDAYESRLDVVLRAHAPAPAVAAARGDAADARFRRGGVEEGLSLVADAVEDYRTACDLGRADACDRAAALTPKDAPPPPKARKRKYQANPSDDSGTRIYAN